MSLKVSLKCHPRCHPITRFIQIWPTYNSFNSIASALRTLLAVGLPKPFLGSGEIVRRKTPLLTKIFFILIYDWISEFVLWLFVNRYVSSYLSKKEGRMGNDLILSWFYFFYGYCSYRIMGCYLQKKSKEILLIHAPTSADYLSVCSFWKHIGKNWE